jgi:hypothetical protein
MSNIILAGSTSGAGTMTVQAPVTSSNRVLTLEDANGTLSPLILGTAQTASGASVNFTGIPSWVKRITMTVAGLSFAAAGGSVVRAGSGSLASTGYTWTQQTFSNTSTAIIGTENPGTHFGNFSANTAAGIVFGYCTLTLVNSATNTWMSQGMASRPSDNNIVQSWVGYVSLSGALDQVSLVAHTSTFDAGTINIMYE